MEKQDNGAHSFPEGAEYEENEMKTIQVKVTRAEKRGRKVILTFESDLFSNEVFAVTPFFDEGDNKNQLQSVLFNLKIQETDGKIKADVSFDNCLSHFTKGHSQLHSPLNTFYLSKRDCAKSWFLNEKKEWYTEERISQILKLWKSDIEFQKELLEISEKRKKQFKIDDLNDAKKEYEIALNNLDKAIKNAEF